MQKSKKHLFCSTFFIALSLVIFGSSTFELCIAREYTDEITKSFSVNQGQLLYLKSDMGSVAVSSWRQNEVKIVITKKAKADSKNEAERIFEDLEIRFEQSGIGVNIIAEYTGPKRWFSGYRKLNVHFEILVPREFNLDISTSGGSISVEDLAGAVNLNTSGGSITVGYIEGTVNAKTSGGSIRVSRANGDVDVHTSGGSISVGEATGSLDAETSGGSISLDGVDGDTKVHTSGGGLNLKNLGGNVQGSTSGGSIYAELIGKIDRDCYLKTSGGGITVLLPRNISVDIDAYTSGGRVSTDFPVTVSGKLKSNVLNGKINNGGPLIKLNTSGGSIRIKEY